MAAAKFLSIAHHLHAGAKMARVNIGDAIDVIAFVSDK